MNATEVAELRDAIYARPSVRPGCDRAHDETWDLVDPEGYSLREVEPGHWHVVAHPTLCGWFCTGEGSARGGCLTWDDVVGRFRGESGVVSPRGGDTA